MNDKHYEGGVCGRCGTTTKYKSNKACVECGVKAAQDPERKARKLQQDRQYYHTNKKELAEYQKTYREKHKIKAAETHKQWREDNKDVVKAKREYERKVSDKIHQRLVVIKARAKKKGLDFTITEADCPLVTICPVFGIELDWAASKQYDNSPSLDRFDSSKGYIPGNVQWISWKANNIKGNFDAEDLMIVAKWMNDNGEENTTK